MKVTWPAFTETTIGRRVAGIITDITRSVAAARAAYTRPAPTPADIVDAAVKAGMAERSAPLSPEEKNLGYWKPFSGLHVENKDLTAQVASAEARRYRVTSGSGNEPYSMQPQPELTLSSIAQAQKQCDVSGWTHRKVDIDARNLRADGHVQCCDRIRRSVYSTAPFRIVPKNGTALAILVANAVRAALDEVDGFSSTAMELAGIGLYGYSVGELVWGERRINIPVGGGSVTVESEIITSIEHVYPRNIVYDLVDDSPWLNMGGNQFVPITPSSQKFVFVKGCGDSPTRWRGYGWANQWLSYLGGLSTEKWGILVETYGVSTPYLSTPGSGYLTDAEHDHALGVLGDLGKARPAVVPSRYGEIKTTPVPSGIAPMHGMLLGYLKAEQSKLILSSTLQVEIGGVGSYAAATTHKDQQTATQKVDASLIAEALRCQPIRWLCEVNATRWANAFFKFAPCSPDDIMALVPRVEWVISDETTTQRLAIFQGVKGMGFAVDEAQVREELGVRAPIGGTFPSDASPIILPDADGGGKPSG